MEDLTGKTFNRLKVVSRGDDRSSTGRTGLQAGYTKKLKTWKCNCVCGNVCVVRQSNLLGNGTKSCGCFKKERQEFRRKAWLKVIKMNHEEMKKFIEE
jgi:hypothetical protein